MVIKTKKLLHSAVLPVVLAMLGAPAFAHEHKVPRGQGIQLNGQPQQGARPDSGPRNPMPGADVAPGQAAAARPQRALIAGNANTMESALARPAQVAGELAPARQVPTSFKGGGTQQGRLKTAADSRTHLRLVLRVTSDGHSEVVSATEMPGEGRVSAQPKGDLLYEVSDGTEALAVESIPDPFEAHSFGGPDDGASGHHFQELTENTIVVTVPNRSLRSTLDRLNVRLYKLTPGAATEEIDLPALAKLKQERRLQTLVEARGDMLGAQIQQRGVRVSQ